MQKQLVLAALFATVSAADCTDANVVLAKAAKARLTTAKVALDAALATAKTAKETAEKSEADAKKDRDGWKDSAAMVKFVAAKKLADAAKVTADSEATAALSDAKTGTTALKKVLDDAKLAASTANTKATATGVADLVTLDNTAGALVKLLTDNETEHNTVKGDFNTLKTNALTAWTDKNTLSTVTDQNAINAAKGVFTAGKIAILNVATGATENVKACTASSPGIALGAEWNSGAQNKADGAVNSAASPSGNVAAYYKAMYLDCATYGYTVKVTAAKTLSDPANRAANGSTATTYSTWYDAQAALETAAYKFGKLKHACVAGASFAYGANATTAAAALLVPCLRTGSLEAAYSAAYPGKQGTPNATFPKTAVTLVGKIGDFGAGAAYNFATPADGAKNAWTGLGYTNDSTYTATTVTDYVAAATVSTAGTAADGLYLVRDNAYDAWLAKVKLTADAIVTENVSKVEYDRLVVLSGAYTAFTAGGTKQGAVGSQARIVEDAIQKQADDSAAKGVAIDRIATATGGTAAAMSQADMVALGDKMISTNAAFGTDNVKGNAILAAATLLTKAYFQAAWNYNKNKVKADQATADKDRAVKARGLTAAALKKAQTDSTVKAYLEAEAQKAYDAQVKVKAAKDATKAKADAAAALSTAMDVIA
jgi:hypothetical protein